MGTKLANLFRFLINIKVVLVRIVKIKYNFVKHAIRAIKIGFGLFEAVNICLVFSIVVVFERPVIRPNFSSILRPYLHGQRMILAPGSSERDMFSAFSLHANRMILALASS